MKKIILWVVLGLVAVFVVYSIVNISMNTARLNSKREATRASQQTASAIDSRQKTNLALTPTIAPLTDLGEACRQGDDTAIEIIASIEPGVLVQTIPSQNVKTPDHFSAESFYIRQGEYAANLWQLKVCGKDFFSDCVYMFNLPAGETKFNPQDLKGYAQKGAMFRYSNKLIISGLINHKQGKSGTEGCLIVVETIRIEN